MLDGERLREARQWAQLSQQRLGELIGQDQQYVSKLERGVLPGMTVETLERLCGVLQVRAGWLLRLEDGPLAQSDRKRPRSRTAAPVA